MSRRIEPCLRHWGPWLVLAGPVLFFLVYGPLRDIPAASRCWSGAVDRDTVERYRAGSWSLMGFAETLALAVYAGALVASRHDPASRAVSTAPAVAGALGGLTGWLIFTGQHTEGIGRPVVLGGAVTAATLWMLSCLAGRRWSWPRFALAAAVALSAPLIAMAAWLAALMPVAAGVVIALVTATLVGLAAARLRRGADTAWAALAATAAWVMVVVLPFALLVVRTRGDQPVIC